MWTILGRWSEKMVDIYDIKKREISLKMKGGENTR